MSQPHEALGTGLLKCHICMFPKHKELSEHGAGLCSSEPALFVCTSIWFHLPFWRCVVLARQSPEV